MRSTRRSAVLLLLGLLPWVIAAAQQERPDATPAAKPARHSKAPLIGPSDGLAVITAALDAHTRRSNKMDCSHLVHDIYERAGFAYDYASSSDLYAGTGEFRRVQHPQPGDLVVWPGHVGIVVNPAQRSFYSALSTGLGVEAYDSAYWKERGRPRFFRYLKTAATSDRASNTRVTR
jgi:cell wall-associated NlpC family hydrolase